MIVLTRDLARRFRAVAKKCMAGRPKGPAPPVVCRAAGGVLTLVAQFDDVILGVSAPGVTGNGTAVVPMAVLGAVEGAGGDSVELRLGPRLTGEATWTDRGVPRSLAFDAIKPGRQHDPPPEPDDWGDVPAHFLAALHECGRTTARDPGRFALHRVQVRGGAGQVAGTDGKVALIAAGFVIPFAADLLVPAVPVFGCRELTAEEDVRVGLADGHLVVRAGPWVVWLKSDPGGKYPDVAGVIPRAADPSLAEIDDRDAEDVLDALPGMPGTDEDGRPVTLDLDSSVVVRAKGPSGVVEVRLPRSAVAGPPMRAALDRAVVARALRLGCRTVRLAENGKPVVFEGTGVTLVTVPFDPSALIPPNATAKVLSTDPTVTPIPNRRTPMKPHETNGNGPNGRHDPPTADAPDPLAEAEALRAVLAEAAARAARLVTALKHRRKEQRAITQVWSSLKSLNLGP